MTEDARSRIVVALEFHGGEGSNYDHLGALLDDLNAIEILDALWITDSDSDSFRVLASLIRALGDDDRAIHHKSAASD